MLQRIIFNDQDISRFQDNVDKAITPLQNATLTGGQLIENVNLSTGVDNLIDHSLGYAPKLILPFAPSAQATIWSPSTSALSNSNVSTTKFNLRTDGICTVNVWVK